MRVVSLAPHGLEVTRREERHTERRLLHAARSSRDHDQHVAAEPADRVPDVGGRSAPHRLHHDDRRNADHDPQHREHRAHLVP
jgi:hypothetical protein